MDAVKGIDRSQFDYLEGLPADASLEGYLFPDTYRFDANDPVVNVVTMLTNFGNKYTPEMRQRTQQMGLTIREGKNVLEFSVRSTTKGEAVEHLRRYVAADAVFYAGDDVTDEDAFAALGPDDVGLKSGDGATLANFRVSGPTEIARAITLLADLREGDVHEQ